MVKIVKKGSKFKLVNSVNGVPVGTPNTFIDKNKAKKRARDFQ